MEQVELFSFCIQHQILLEHRILPGAEVAIRDWNENWDDLRTPIQIYMIMYLGHKITFNYFAICTWCFFPTIRLQKMTNIHPL